MPALTGIRLPFALWVVVHHISHPGGMLDPLNAANPALQSVIEAAWVALSVFFAISGFVLARRYRGTIWSRDTLAAFAAARFGRIYPVYALSLLILAPIIFQALRHDELGSPAQRTVLLLNYLLLLQGWKWPSTDWNTPAWSLSCEVFFYACTPIVLHLVRRNRVATVAATAVVACAVPIVVRLLVEPPTPKALLYFGDFLIGIAMGGLYDRTRRGHVRPHRLGPWLQWSALAAGLALLIFRGAIGSFLLFDTGVRLVSALLVFGLACGGGWLAHVLSSPTALTGGRASYAIYILHIPVLWWFEWFKLDNALPPLYAGTVYLVIVVALSLAVSRKYEEPVNDYLRRRRTGRRRDQDAGSAFTARVRQGAPPT